MIESAFVQSISAIALLGYGAFHLLYFSPKALRHLAAWAMARADSIEFELAKRKKYLVRLGEVTKPTSTPAVGEAQYPIYDNPR